LLYFRKRRKRMAKEQPIIEIEEEEEGQAIEGYGCICGFKTVDKKEFNSHIFRESLKDGKGTHKSLGRINMLTDEVIMPPWVERTDEQKKSSLFAKKKSTGGRDGQVSKQTDVLDNASQIKFIPRVYSADYTPIMRAGREVAIREWGWDIDMTLTDFLDTCLHHFFRDRNYVLSGYTKINQEEEKDGS